jgi:hypothetical protein
MSAIAVLTDPEDRPAAGANPLPQNHVMSRHIRPLGGTGQTATVHVRLELCGEVTLL